MKRKIGADWLIVKKEPLNSVWVQIIVHMKNNETGEVRQCHITVILDEENNRPHTYNWEEGNFSCDCNRQLFFDGTDAECGDDKFNVNLQNPVTGTYFYKEFDTVELSCNH